MTQLAVTVLAISLTSAVVEATEFELLPYSSNGYAFSSVRYDGLSEFSEDDFDYSFFPTGKMPFGTAFGCALNVDGSLTPNQYCPIQTDILVARPFYLVAGISDVRIFAAADDRVQVFFNEVDVSGGMRVHDNCPELDSLAFNVPNSILRFYPEVNHIKIRARDLGGASYINIRILGTAAGKAMISQQRALSGQLILP